MKNILKYTFALLCSVIVFASCEETDYRTVYPHSTPVIESAAINPATFVYGDSVNITATVSDPTTPLSTLEMTMIVNDKVLVKQSIRTKDKEVDYKFHVPFVSELPNDADVEIQLTLINVEGDSTKGSIPGVKGMRKYYEKLYLVTDAGTVVELNPNTENKDFYVSDQIGMDGNSVKYKIASKLTSDNKIDYSEDVWGWKNGAIQLIDLKGDFITTIEPLLVSLEKISFDTYFFTTDLIGPELSPLDGNLSVNMMADTTINKEAFKYNSFYIEKNQVITLDNELSNAVFNLDYFERISGNSVKFIGETGGLKLEYNPTRKYVLVEDPISFYPNVLLITGIGLGYPSKTPEATTSWGFDQAMQYILCKKVGDDIYQSTIYMDVEKANFKYFENKGWDKEKKSDDYQLPTDVLQANPPDDEGKRNGNWIAADGAESGIYKITINLATKEVTAEKITL